MSQDDLYVMTIIWGDSALKKRFETAPYSLSKFELEMLSAHHQFSKALQINCL